MTSSCPLRDASCNGICPALLNQHRVRGGRVQLLRVPVAKPDAMVLTGAYPVHLQPHRTLEEAT